MCNDGTGEETTGKGHPSQGTAGPPKGELIALNPKENKSKKASVIRDRQPQAALKKSKQRKSKRAEHRAQKKFVHYGWKIARQPPKKLSMRQENNARNELHKKNYEILRRSIKKERKKQGKKEGHTPTSKRET